jgi:hypothetical protein
VTGLGEVVGTELTKSPDMTAGAQDQPAMGALKPAT